MRDIALPIIYGWLLNNALLLMFLSAVIYAGVYYYVTFIETKQNEHVDLMERYIKLQLHRRYHRE